MSRTCFCFAILVRLNAALAAPAVSEPSSYPGPATISIPRDRYVAIHHVSPGGGDKADGSAARPWPSVRHALAQINDAGPDRRHALLIASGTYAESPIIMKPHIDLFGGFDPSTWNRDIASNATILDARHASRVVTGASHARLDGFTLRNGRFRGPGGAILCDRASPTITNNTLLHNQTLEPEGYIHELLHQTGHDGGAIACLNGAAPLIANNLIAHNTTGVGGGGAIASLNHSAPTIVNNVLSDNLTGTTDRNRSRSSNGGAISCSNLPVRVEKGERLRARISGNYILNNRVGGNSDAGGIYCEYDAHPEISRNMILGNYAEDDGGAIYVMKSSEPLISANVIAGNKGGGAIRLSKEGRARIENNLLFANDEGAVTCADSWMHLVHNTIVSNSGRGLSYENTTPHLKPSLVVGNILHNNLTPHLRESPESSLIMTHNLLQVAHAGDGNMEAVPLFEEDAASGAVQRASYDSHRVQTTLFLAGPSPLEKTALMERPVQMNGRWGIIAGIDGDRITVWGDLTPRENTQPLRVQIPSRHRLRAGSPGIDQGPPSGAPTHDIDGQPRPSGGGGARPDMGADEFFASTRRPPAAQ